MILNTSHIITAKRLYVLNQKYKESFACCKMMHRFGTYGKIVKETTVSSGSLQGEELSNFGFAEEE